MAFRQLFSRVVTSQRAPLFAASALTATSWMSWAESRKETNTGVEFETATTQGLQLRGCGCRYKYGFAKVYAVALYTEPEFKILDGQDALEAMSQSGVKNELQFTLVRALDSQTFIKALEEQLLPRVSDKAQADAFVKLCDATLPKALPNGHHTAIRFEDGGRIIMFNAEKGTSEAVFAPQVASAMLDIYLGKDTVSPSARDEIYKGLLA